MVNLLSLFEVSGRQSQTGRRVGRRVWGGLEYVQVFIVVVTIFIYPFPGHWEIPIQKVEELLKLIAIY